MKPIKMKLLTILVMAAICFGDIQAAKIEKYTLELGGLFGGTYQFSSSSNFFVTTLSPILTYYFANHWFLEVGLGLQYVSSTYPGISESRSFSIMPSGGLGYYLRLSEVFVFAVPIFFNTAYYFSHNNGYTEDGFGPSVNYGLRPTIKAQVSDSVNLGLYFSMQAMLVNLRQYTVPAVWTYGLSWTYCW